MCGRTIEDVIKNMSFVALGFFVVSFMTLPVLNDACAEAESTAVCALLKGYWMVVGISVGGFLFLCIAIVVIRRGLVG